MAVPLNDPILEQWDKLIEQSQHIKNVRALLAKCRQRNLSDTKDMPDEWQKAYEESVNFCHEMLAHFKPEKSFISQLLEKELWDGVNTFVSAQPTIKTHIAKSIGIRDDDLGQIELQIDPETFKSAVFSDKFVYRAAPEIAASLLPHASVTDQDFRTYLTKITEGDMPARKHTKGTPPRAFRNVLIVGLIEALTKLGWPAVDNPANKIKGSAISIVLRVVGKEYNLAAESQVTLARIWKESRRQKKMGLTYLGAPVKNRKNAALELLTHVNRK